MVLGGKPGHQEGGQETELLSQQVGTGGGGQANTPHGGGPLGRRPQQFSPFWDSLLCFSDMSPDSGQVWAPQMKPRAPREVADALGPFLQGHGRRCPSWVLWTLRTPPLEPTLGTHPLPSDSARRPVLPLPPTGAAGRGFQQGGLFCRALGTV